MVGLYSYSACTAYQGTEPTALNIGFLYLVHFGDVILDFSLRLHGCEYLTVFYDLVSKYIQFVMFETVQVFACTSFVVLLFSTYDDQISVFNF
jgi:hypothetical protein